MTKKYRNRELRNTCETCMHLGTATEYHRYKKETTTCARLMCFRYPKSISVSLDHFCGEYWEKVLTTDE